MSDEQSIRDELVKISGETYCATEECQGECVADAILASPVIRRIQAEAEAKALRDFRARLMEQNIDRFGIVLPDLHEVLDDLDEEADRIERGETA